MCVYTYVHTYICTYARMCVCMIVCVCVCYIPWLFWFWSTSSRTQHGESPLHIAAGYGFIHITQMLLDSGASIDIKDKARICTQWLIVVCVCVFVLYIQLELPVDLSASLYCVCTYVWPCAGHEHTSTSNVSAWNVYLTVCNTHSLPLLYHKGGHKSYVAVCA